MQAISSREVVQALVQTKPYSTSHAIDIALSAQMGKAFLAKPKFLPVRMYKGQETSDESEEEILEMPELRRPRPTG